MNFQRAMKGAKKKEKQQTLIAATLAQFRARLPSQTES
jgi:hypothetical protein